MTKIRRSHTSAHGQALVEFALAIPLLLLLVVGLFDFGRAIYAYNTIANAARVGTRLAIVDQNPATVKQAAINEAVALALQPTDVAVTYSCPVGPNPPVTLKIGCLVSVDVAYGYAPATPLIGALVGSITLRSSSQMPVERVYVSP